jgi:hypothetical protein
MSKVLTTKEVADIVYQAIATPSEALWAKGVASPYGVQVAFLKELGELFARSFGGEFVTVDDLDDGDGLGPTLHFKWNRVVPDNGGVYAGYDIDLSVEEWRAEAVVGQAPAYFRGFVSLQRARHRVLSVANVPVAGGAAMMQVLPEPPRLTTSELLALVEGNLAEASLLLMGGLRSTHFLDWEGGFINDEGCDGERRRVTPGQFLMDYPDGLGRVWHLDQLIPQ